MTRKSARTDAGEAAVRFDLGEFAGRRADLYAVVQLSRPATGPLRLRVPYRLEGWTRLRYVHCGLLADETAVGVMKRRDIAGRWYTCSFDTPEVFYQRGYRALVAGRTRSSAIRVVVSGTPGPKARVTLGPAQVSQSDRRDPLSTPIRLRLPGTGLVSLPTDLSRTAAYFAGKPPAPWPAANPTRRTASVSPDRRATADEMVKHRRYRMGDFPATPHPPAPPPTEDPHTGMNWRGPLPTLGFLVPLLQAYEGTGDVNYLRHAQGLIESWLERAMVDPPEGSPAWNDAGAATRLTVLLRFWESYRARDPDPDALARLLRCIWLHGLAMASPHFYAKDQPIRYTNHALLQDQALLDLCLVLPEFESSASWARLASERAVDQVRHTITPEGVHIEQSPSYHLVMMKMCHSLAHTQKALGVQDTIGLPSLLEQMARYMTYVIAPDGSLVLFGDSSAAPTPAAMLDPTTQWSRALRYASSEGRRGSRPAAPDAAFPRSGYAFFRDRWRSASDFDQTTYVAFTAAYNSITHKHFDDLSFVAFALGEWWLIDPGLYTYNRDDPFYPYARSFSAHNTIVVDGATPRLNTADVGKSRIDGWGTGDSLSYVHAHHTLIPGATIRRSLYYLKPSLLLVVDEVESERAREVTLPLHFAPQAVVTPDGHSRWRVRSQKTGRGMVVEAVWPRVSASIMRGQTTPQVQGWFFPKYHHRVPAPVLELSTRGRSLRLLTVVQLPSRERSRRSARDLLARRANEFSELKAVQELWARQEARP